ncbi:MAG: ParA family protein [Oscillospiraceae bacterium]|nr:ParA family protein [Oscillospiraceae bacterium]
MGKVLVVSNRKGGCGKSMTAASLGVGLAKQGKKVLLLDADSQNSLTVSLGITEPDKLPVTLATVMSHIISEIEFDPTDGIIRHAEGVDLMPSNNKLDGMEISLAPLIGRETVLRQYIEILKPLYEYILIDTAPKLDLLTINALAAADSIIIPVRPKFLDAKGLELLLKAVSQVKRQINPNLEISGILLTMVDTRANFTREVISTVESAYGSNIRIFSGHIPHSVRADESSAQGISIYSYDPRGKVAVAYESLVREVLNSA